MERLPPSVQAPRPTYRRRAPSRERNASHSPRPPHTALRDARAARSFSNPCSSLLRTVIPCRDGVARLVAVIAPLLSQYGRSSGRRKRHAVGLGRKPEAVGKERYRVVEADQGDEL